ncbi:MAG: hypothetical protein JNM76_14780 [Betaproteobacteria bacterium]|nr:hypothetical protein [Betaproteobacteria bacterium]
MTTPDHLAQIRAALAKAQPGPLRTRDIAIKTNIREADVHAALVAMRETGEIVACNVFAGGIEQIEARLSEGTVLAVNCSLGPLSHSNSIAARRTQRAAAEQKGLLRIPGSAGPRTPPRRLENLATIGPADPPAPTPAEPSRTTTQERRTMSKTNGTADTVAAALTSTPQTVAAIAVATGLDEKAVSNALQRLKPAGKAKREGRGLWVSVVPRAASAATAPLVKPAAEEKSTPAKPPARSKKVGSFKLNVELDTSQAIAQIGQLKDLSQSPVNILKLEGGDLLVLRGNIVKAQLDPAEVDALRKAA